MVPTSRVTVERRSRNTEDAATFAQSLPGDHLVQSGKQLATGQIAARPERLPAGFETIGRTSHSPFAAVANLERRIFGVQFHPEVVHTPRGAALISNFVHKIAGLPGDWTMAHFRTAEIAKIREQVGGAKVISGLSGGVDSAVASVLIHEAIGDQLTCIFVDHGLLRAGEAESVVEMFRGAYNIPLVHVDARERFLTALDGVEDPATVCHA